MILRMNQPKDKATVISYIEKLPDQQYIVTIEKKKVKRTVPQNKLYWLWINCIAKETGDDANHIHYELGERFLWKVQHSALGIVREITVSTTMLNTVQFKTYLDQINVLAAEYGVVLPNPEDLYFDQMMDYYSDKF